jgi:hypothetical protein
MTAVMPAVAAHFLAHEIGIAFVVSHISLYSKCAAYHIYPGAWFILRHRRNPDYVESVSCHPLGFALLPN